MTEITYPKVCLGVYLVRKQEVEYARADLYLPDAVFYLEISISLDKVCPNAPSTLGTDATSYPRDVCKYPYIVV